MKTCTVCGGQAPESAERCPVDGALLVTAEDDTVVRSKPSAPVDRPRFTVEDISRPVAPRVARPTEVQVRTDKPMWPVAVTIGVAATIGVAVFIYFLYSQRSREVDAINAQIADARVAVADAKARIESLPLENPLRQRIITLDKWDRELQGFQLSTERSAEMAARARDITTQAEQVSDAARSAGATMAIKPEVPPATATPPADDPIAAPHPADGQAEPAPEGNTNTNGASGADERATEGKGDAIPGSNANVNSNTSTSPGTQPLPPPPPPPPPATNTPRSTNSNSVNR